MTVGGTDVTALSEGALAKWRSRHVGFIFQFYNLIPVLTAVENVELPLLLTKLSKKQRRERALTALKVVGLADRCEALSRGSSRADRNSASRSRARSSTDPAVLVADEPTGDLDAKSAEDILNLLETLNREFKKTIVMVTHDPRAAARAHVERHLEKGVLHGDRDAPRRDGLARVIGSPQSGRAMMKYLPYVLKHLRRNWIRTAQHVLGMALCIFLICVLQTVLEPASTAR